MDKTLHESDTSLYSKKRATFRLSRNISPIPEIFKSAESSLHRQASIVSDPDIHCGKTFRAGLLITTFSVHWLISTFIFAVGLSLTLYHAGYNNDCYVYFTIVYLRIFFWIITYIQHELIKPACQRLINQNYNLYQDMTCYRKAPLRIVSFWNIILIAIQANIRSLFAVDDREANICKAVGDVWELSVNWNISPQLFITVFCCLETIALTCFYIPAIKRLMKSIQQQSEEDSPNRTLSNQDDISINQRLKRQAEQVKILRTTHTALVKEAVTLGVFDEDQ
ncbi:uncharacterized protein LOC128745554 [Sabethes cyaneus]|uniref:uncharacterized protein LOC128745554 n=1 Tax=Sabethes cyaneus TaxID=53552 RepID=UPI00237D3B6B|nr:uncharacterized protein LOC128745554 [Sabethes cyaneus]